jgi:hypothetical protein
VVGRAKVGIVGVERVGRVGVGRVKALSPTTKSVEDILRISLFLRVSLKAAASGFTAALIPSCPF